MTVLKRILLILLLATTSLSLAAQEKEDTTFVFRFIADRDMFFSPWKGNEGELARLTACIKENRSAIDNGQMYLLVTSYATEGKQRQKAPKVAHIRRSRVKSELITRLGIKEENFVTDPSYLDPYVSDGDSLHNVVVVVIPASVAKVVELAGSDVADKVDAYNRSASSDAKVTDIDAQTPEPECETPQETVEQTPRQEPVQTAPTVSEGATTIVATDTKDIPYNFAIRANLLRWATLTPDLGVEWRISNSVGFVVNGTYTTWCWNEKHRKYALWEVAPEVRWYLGKARRGYVGAMYKTGTFNYKFSHVGKQGNIMGGGITGGYQLAVGKAFMFDFTLALGWLDVDKENYTVKDNRRIFQDEKSTNWWGPIDVGVTLVWNVF